MAYSINSKCIGCPACKKICPAHAISGEKKEQHLIHDDLCIECGACGRVCPQSAVEDPFGVTVLRIKKKEWDRPFVDMAICTSCNICIDTCPVEALEEKLQIKGNPRPFSHLPDEGVCIGCGFCAADCPVSAITMRPRNQAGNPEKGNPAREMQN